MRSWWWDSAARASSPRGTTVARWCWARCVRATSSASPRCCSTVSAARPSGRAARSSSGDSSAGSSRASCAPGRRPGDGSNCKPPSASWPASSGNSRRSVRFRRPCLRSSSTRWRSGQSRRERRWYARARRQARCGSCGAGACASSGKRTANAVHSPTCAGVIGSVNSPSSRTSHVRRPSSRTTPACSWSSSPRPSAH